MLCGDLNGKEIQKRGDICICITGSLCCTAETNNVGTTQRDGMGREEGGGFRMGNTCIPVADSF